MTPAPAARAASATVRFAVVAALLLATLTGCAPSPVTAAVVEQLRDLAGVAGATGTAQAGTPFGGQTSSVTVELDAGATVAQIQDVVRVWRDGVHDLEGSIELMISRDQYEVEPFRDGRFRVGGLFSAVDLERMVTYWDAVWLIARSASVWLDDDYIPGTIGNISLSYSGEPDAESDIDPAAVASQLREESADLPGAFAWTLNFDASAGPVELFSPIGVPPDEAFAQLATFVAPTTAPGDRFYSAEWRETVLRGPNRLRVNVSVQAPDLAGLSAGEVGERASGDPAWDVVEEIADRLAPDDDGVLLVFLVADQRMARLDPLSCSESRGTSGPTGPLGVQLWEYWLRGGRSTSDGSTAAVCA